MTTDCCEPEVVIVEGEPIVMIVAEEPAPVTIAVPGTDTILVVQEPTPTQPFNVELPGTVLLVFGEKGERGPQGEQGEKGEKGERGEKGEVGDLHFLFRQEVASAVWVIEHNLANNKFPSVTVEDSANSEIEGDIEYVNENVVVLTFSAAFTGTAYLN